MRKGISLNQALFRLFRNELFIFFLFVLVVTLLTFDKWPDWAKEFSYKTSDIQVNLLHNYGYTHDVHEDVVVLEIDGRAINDFGRWPWNRSVIASLFSNLELASVVVTDIVFSENSSFEDDQVLANTIEDMDNVVLGFFLRSEEFDRKGAEAFPLIEKCALQRVENQGQTNLKRIDSAEVNIPMIAAASMSCAVFSTTSDTDGIYRRYELMYDYQQELAIPSLAVQAFQFYTDQELEVELYSEGVQLLTGKQLEIEQRNNFTLNFPKKVATISAADVLSGKVPPEYFDGKVIFIGVTEIGVFDIRPTTLDEYTPGVHLHAVAMSNMLQNNWIEDNQSLSLFFALSCILFITLISIVISRNKTRWFIYSILFFGLFAIATAHLYQSNEILNLFEIFFYSFLCLMMLEGRKLLQMQNRYMSVRNAFSSYVAPQVVKMIIDQGIDPEEGRRKVVNVMFTDIQNFTNLSENLEPEQVINLLYTVFTPVTKCIMHNQGLLDKYIGDEVMALFNAPHDLEDFNNKSIQAAIEVQQSLKSTNIELQKLDLPTVALSLGLANGPAVVGNMGSEQQRDYTAIGNTVNLAARITSLSKVYGQQILINIEIFEQLSETLKQKFQFIDNVIVKGKSSVTRLYGCQQVDETVADEAQSLYADSYELYRSGDFVEAAKGFKQLVSDFDHRASHCLLLRCQQFQLEPPEQWNGDYKFDRK